MNFPRAFFSAVLLGIGLVTAGAQTAAPQPTAQAAPAGPVHFPANYSSTPVTNAPASAADTNSSSSQADTKLAQPAPGAVAPPVNAMPNSSAIVSPSATTTAPTSDVDTATDIRDVRGLMSIPYQWLWVIYSLVALIVAGVAYAIWAWFRNRKRTPAKEPYEIALEKLEAARALMTETQVREYAFTVSEIIRSYIEQRFGERAAHRTTEEFLSDLLQSPNVQLAEYRDLLQDFLNHCDLPKFARWQLSVREMESMHESARAFISDTRPQQRPVPQPELASAK